MLSMLAWFAVHALLLGAGVAVVVAFKPERA
jgi:hypothetical protein